MLGEVGRGREAVGGPPEVGEAAYWAAPASNGAQPHPYTTGGPGLAPINHRGWAGGTKSEEAFVPPHLSFFGLKLLGW